MKTIYEILNVTNKTVNECCPDCQPSHTRCLPNRKIENTSNNKSKWVNTNFCQPDCNPNKDNEAQ